MNNHRFILIGAVLTTSLFISSFPPGEVSGAGLAGPSIARPAQPLPVSVRPDSIGVTETCNGYSLRELSSQWRRTDGGYQTRGRLLSDAQVSEIRQTVLNSEEPIDYLKELEFKVNLQKLEALVVETHPGLEAKTLDSGAIEERAREALQADVCTTGTRTFQLDLGGEPPILAEGSADPIEVGPWVVGLPEWRITVGDRQWTTRDPRVTLALSQLCCSEWTEPLTEVYQWPDRFYRSEVARMGGRVFE